MAGSVNRVFLIGRLGKDPEVRNLQDGGKIVNLTLATSESWNDRASGERKERVEWHRLTIIGNDRLADIAERFLKKGSLIHAEGSLQTRKWTDQQGQERYTTEVVIGRFNGTLTMLDTRSGGNDEDSHQSSGGHHGGASRDAPRGGGGGRGRTHAGPGSDLDDEIPFVFRDEMYIGCRNKVVI